ncbi:HD domain-containing protein [Streptomyces sp. 8K308]|uniref:HD domain-containing protein n=1 Tax=Streptomyces sp. 8K308 TaxID=2530388 RepID=UPI00104ED57E|nr:HD domain-containing protein [Streptomyces sp. 8K308]TDC13423.1 HD domain-containing protein [Streptomyces sp. 8K308]
MPGIELSLPATEIATSAREFAERIEAPFLFNHSVRAYLFGSAVAAEKGLKAGDDYDDELLFLACVLHDVGLTDEGNGNQRFEVDGADLAVRFLREQGVEEERTRVVWDAIALHTSLGIASRKGLEVALMQRGTSLDVIGWGAEDLPEGFADEVHAQFPRLEVEERLADAIVQQVLANPAKGEPTTFPGELVRQRVPSVRMLTWEDMVAGSPWPDV